jgi:hypothetical protein
MNPTTVVNIKREEYDFWCARGGIWGNPFLIGPDGTREEVIAKYREWILTQPKLLAQLPALRGKRLGCFCKPLACHCDVLAELADALPVAPSRPPRIIDLSSGTQLDIRQA